MGERHQKRSSFEQAQGTSVNGFISLSTKSQATASNIIIIWVKFERAALLSKIVFRNHRGLGAALCSMFVSLDLRVHSLEYVS